jgi:hypothetical protein
MGGLNDNKNRKDNQINETAKYSTYYDYNNIAGTFKRRRN